MIEQLAALREQAGATPTLLNAVEFG